MPNDPQTGTGLLPGGFYYYSTLLARSPIGSPCASWRFYAMCEPGLRFRGSFISYCQWLKARMWRHAELLGYSYCFPFTKPTHLQLDTTIHSTFPIFLDHNTAMRNVQHVYGPETFAACLHVYPLNELSVKEVAFSSEKNIFSCTTSCTKDFR